MFSNPAKTKDRKQFISPILVSLAQSADDSYKNRLRFAEQDGFNYLNNKSFFDCINPLLVFNW